jgi:cytosine/adenosine deaminase-related metal-dependent hydrolase
MPPARVHRARWIIPASGPAIPDGAVVSAGGRIERIGPWRRIRPHLGPSDTVAEFPDAAILPGLVNGHTHLAYSQRGTRKAQRGTKNFAAWIARLTARRLASGRAALARAVRDGARLSAAAGTAAGADLTPDLKAARVLVRAPGCWTVFGEVFRFGEAGLRHLANVVQNLEALAREGGLRVGLSPHTPWTVGPEVFLAARQAADARGWPITTHLHETLDELAMYERGTGPLSRWMRRVGVLPRGWKAPRQRPIPLLAEAGFFRGPVLVAHANYLADEEIAILVRSGSSVAFCPRSHAFFRHTGHPWRQLLEAGVNVCLGTDSLASSPSLSVLDEARFLFEREAPADPRTLLEMMTVRGARALGLEAEFGDLRPGLHAALCIVGPLPETNDPLAAVLTGGGGICRILRH